MKTKEPQAESIRQGLQEMIDFAEGKPVEAVVHSERFRLLIDDSNKAKRRAAAWTIVADIACCLMILMIGGFVYRNGLKAEGVAIGIMFAAAHFITFLAGEMQGVEREKEIAWKEAVEMLNRTTDKVKNEIAAKEMQS